MATNYMGTAGGTIPFGADDFIEGDAANALATGKLISGEQALWLAVVGRCWLDAFETNDPGLRNTDSTCDPEIVRAQARRWLTLDFAGWCEDRETVCIMAGIEPDLIRDAARRRLRATRIEAANDLDRSFLRLVESPNPWTPPNLTGRSLPLPTTSFLAAMRARWIKTWRLSSPLWKPKFLKFF